MSPVHLQRTSFRYDMMPWKLVFCEFTHRQCLDKRNLLTILISDLPAPPEPGRVPEGCDHVHITVKLSADQRNAREEEKWAALLKATARCLHGKMAGEICRECPGSRAPDIVGMRIGTAHDGEPVIIPAYEDLNDPKAWTPNRNRDV